MIEYTDTMRENRTGVTRFNQGMEADTLNQTATGYKGLMDSSQQREQLIARMLGEGVKTLFNKIISLAHKYQNEVTQIRATNDVMEVDPTAWRYKMDCSVQVGLGSGDRQEKIQNLNFILQQQKELMQLGSVVSDEVKMFNTFDKLVTEVGLKDVDLYFNDPEKPDEVLQAENQQLMEMVKSLEAQVQENPLAEAEMVKQQGAVAIAQAKLVLEEEKMKLDAFDKESNREFDYTELEVKENADIPGKGVNG